MNHLYCIRFSVSEKEDFLEQKKYRAIGYVAAECPYQAMFFVRHELSESNWESNGTEIAEKINLYMTSINDHSYIDQTIKEGGVIIRINDEIALQETSLST